MKWGVVMAHNVYFYSCSCNPNNVDKSGSLAFLGSSQILRPTHQINVLTPAFSIDYNGTLVNANYCYIDTFGRWYFCTVSTDTAQRMAINASVDVLYTYKSAILSSGATVIRRENYNGSTGCTYVPDKKLPLDPCRSKFDGYRLSLIANTNYGNYFVAINGG